jgi:hypothetical protein
MKDEYDRARDVLIEAIEDDNSIYDIWEYGTYKNPGLSDMDLMIIVKDDAEVLRVKSDIEKVVKHDDVSSAMAHANPIVFPLSNCNDAFLWDDISAFSLREKKTIKDQVSDRIIINYRNIAMMVDFVFERIYRVNQYRIGNLEDFRRVLGVCKSLRYSFDRLIDLVKLDENTILFLQRFSDALDETRATFTKDRGVSQEQLKAIVQLACDAGAIVHEEIYKKGLPIFERVTDIPDLSYEFVFPDKMIYSFNDELKINSENYVNLPVKCLLQLLTYSLAGGALSSSLKSSFRLPNGIGFEKLSLWHLDLIEHNSEIAAYHHYLESRIKSANKWYDFLVKREMPYGLFKFGWYLPKH